MDDPIQFGANNEATQHPAMAMALEMPEILENIFKYLVDPYATDLVNSALVCRKWRDAAYHPSLWKRELASITLGRSDITELLPSLARRRVPMFQVRELRTNLNDLLPSLPSLKMLHLVMLPRCRRQNVVTDRTLTGAFQQRHTSLISLNLYECKKITDASVILLSNRLPNLEILVLIKCPLVTDVGLVEVARHLSQMRNLALDYCAITDAGVAALAGHRPEVAFGTPRLCSLSMIGCRRISDDALLRISAAWPGMMELRLSRSPLITDVGLQHLANATAVTLERIFLPRRI